MTENNISLEELYSLIAQKISNKEQNSYSYQLSQEGIEKINRKVGEEALEVVIASFIDKENPNSKNRQDLIGEVADLFYHSLVLLADKKIDFSEVLTELTKRNKNKK